MMGKSQGRGGGWKRRKMGMEGECRGGSGMRWEMGRESRGKVEENRRRVDFKWSAH